MDHPKNNRLVEALACLTLVVSLVLPCWYVMTEMNRPNPGVGVEHKILWIGATAILLCLISGLALFAARKQESVGHLRAAVGAVVASVVITGAFVFTGLAQHNRQVMTDSNIAVGTDPSASPNLLWGFLIIGGPTILLIGLGFAALRNRSASTKADRSDRQTSR